MIRFPNRQALTLHPATSRDIDSIAAIDEAAGVSANAPRAAELLAMGKSWIARVEGTPAGYALVSRRFFSRPFVELLVVNPAWRRRGVGAMLLARCERAHDDDRIFTSTNQSNAPMRALLAQCGYEPSGVIENLDPGDPEMVFVKFRPQT